MSGYFFFKKMIVIPDDGDFDGDEIVGERVGELVEGGGEGVCVGVHEGLSVGVDVGNFEGFGVGVDVGNFEG